MEILGIVGSNRKNGSSYLFLKEIFHSLSGIEGKIIQVAELEVKPCELCFDLCAKNPFECVIDDDLRMLVEEMKSADGIMIVCPFYFYIPSKFQPFLERLSCLDYSTQEKHGKEHRPLVGKPCSLMTVSASGSSFNAFQILHHLQEFALMLGMRPVTTNFWPFIGLSVKSGDLEKDAILKERKTIERAKELLNLFIMEIEKSNKEYRNRKNN